MVAGMLHSSTACTLLYVSSSSEMVKGLLVTDLYLSKLLHRVSILQVTV